VKLRIGEERNYDVVSGGLVPEETVQLHIGQIIFAGGDNLICDFGEIFGEFDVTGPAAASPELLGGLISDQTFQSLIIRCDFKAAMPKNPHQADENHFFNR
jgi:hypothetical protein